MSLPSNLVPPWRRNTRRLAVSLGIAIAAMGAACTPVPTVPNESTTTTVVDHTIPVSGAQLSWSYSQYAQYGVFGPWSQTPVGDNVQVNLVDGETVTGLASEAGVTYQQGQFDGGTGSIDPVTGEGSITWDTGDWVLNAYNGLFGAPDETLRDPVLDIAADGTGSLSFEAYIPLALDIDGNPAGSAGPDRITIATFSSVQLGEGGLTVTPDFAGRAYVPDESSYGGEGTVSCLVDGVETGGSWPAEYIDFLPPSVKAHYFTTGCSGLNLRKPPTPFTVTWAPSDAAITRQPSLSASSFYASALPRNFGASVGVTGVPTPTVQWERSHDGLEWTALPGATGTGLARPLEAADHGASFRAVVGGAASDVIGPVSVLTEAVTTTLLGPEVTVGRGEPLTLTIRAAGAPTPSVVWERSDDDGLTWSDVVPDGEHVVNTDTIAPGTATTASAYFAGLRYVAASDAEDGAQFRIRAGNGVGAPAQVVSDVVTTRVRFDVPSFTGHPLSTAAFEGQEVSISAYTTGLPKPTVQWQRSTDAGATWSDVTSNTPTNVQIPATEVTLDKDGTQFRVVATSAAGTTISDPATVRVFERLPGRQLRVVPSESIDPTVRNTVTVIGSGWEPSTVGNMRVAVTNSSVWQPGLPGIAVAQAHSAATVSRAALTSNNGDFRTSHSVAANAFTNPGVVYGVGTFGVTTTDRFYDSWSPISVNWPPEG